MGEISEAKRLNVVDLYLKGYSANDIVEETGISKGSVINILQEVRMGKLDRLSLKERIDELHKLSLKLKKEGIDLSQARLGLTFWERLEEVGIKSEELESLITLHREISSADFPKEDFLDASLALLRLREGRLFNFSQVKEKGNILEQLSSSLAELERGLSEKQSCLSQLAHELQEEKKKVEGLQTRKGKLEEEISQREEALSSLSQMGFGKAWLKEFKGRIEEVAKSFSIRPKDAACSLIDDLDLILKKEGAKLALEEEAQRLTREVEEKRKEREKLRTAISKEEAQREEILKEKERIEASIDEVKEKGLKSIEEINKRAVTNLEGLKEGMGLLADEALKKGKEIGEIETKIEHGSAFLGDLLGFLKNPYMVDYETTKELVLHLQACIRIWASGHHRQIDQDADTERKLPQF